MKKHMLHLLFAGCCLLVAAGCAPKATQASADNNPKGIIRTCDYTMGESACGKCYCLETPESGCEIIDISAVGDLANYVGKSVTYKGTRDQSVIQSTKMCPHYIKLFSVSLSEEG
jgi:hypothetical protein